MVAFGFSMETATCSDTTTALAWWGPNRRLCPPLLSKSPCNDVAELDEITWNSRQSVWGSYQKLHVFAAWESWEDWLGLQRIPRASRKRTTTQVEIWIAYLGRIGCPTQQCNCTVCRETQVPTHNLWTVCVELCVSLLTYETIGHIWPIANSTKGASPRYNAKLARPLVT